MSAHHAVSSITEFDELAVRKQAAALRATVFRRFLALAWNALQNRSAVRRVPRRAAHV